MPKKETIAKQTLYLLIVLCKIEFAGYYLVSAHSGLGIKKSGLLHPDLFYISCLSLGL